MQSFLQLHDPEAIRLYETKLREFGLGFFQAEQQSIKMLPASLHGLTVDESLWQRLVDETQILLGALPKVMRWLKMAPQNALRERMWQGLTEQERQVALDAYEQHLGNATMRLDLFWDRDQFRVLEINATIPAMQAYSDMVNEAFLAAYSLQERKNYQSLRSNTQDLLQSLLKHFQLVGGRRVKPRIAIICRANDSQLSELQWQARQWSAAGYETVVAQPEAVSVEGEQVSVHGQPVDLIYRHIFAPLIPADSAMAKICLQPRRFKAFNPYSAHLEVKGLIACLSQLASHKLAAVFNQVEIRCIQRLIPWTRLLLSGPTTLSDGSESFDLVDWVRDNPEQVVIKNNNGYGGHLVFLGRDFELPDSQEKARRRMQRQGAISWREWIDFVAQQQDELWIVQSLVPGKQLTLPVVLDHKTTTASYFVDCSLFACTGNHLRLQGGVVRFAEDPIVNLGRGGGLAPFFIKSDLKA